MYIIRALKCKNGHSNFSLAYDNNECSCHHNGMPVLRIDCVECLIEYFNKPETKKIVKGTIKSNSNMALFKKIQNLEIPLDKETNIKLKKIFLN